MADCRLRHLLAEGLIGVNDEYCWIFESAIGSIISRRSSAIDKQMARFAISHQHFSD